MGWLIALAAAAGIAVLPLGVKAVYDSTGLKVWFLLGRFPMLVYPGRKKDKPKAGGGQKQMKKSGTGEQSGGSTSDFIPAVRSVLKLLSDFRRKLRVRLLQVHITLAGDDPADLALNHGRAWVAAGNLMPQLERFFVIQKKDIRLNSDFTADKTLVYARLELTITVGQLLYLAVQHGSTLLKDFLNIMKLRKGGANP